MGQRFWEDHPPVREGGGSRKEGSIAGATGKRAIVGRRKRERGVPAGGADGRARGGRCVENVTGRPAARPGGLRPKKTELGARPEPVSGWPDFEVGFRQPEECVGQR